MAPGRSEILTAEQLASYDEWGVLDSIPVGFHEGCSARKREAQHCVAHGVRVLVRDHQGVGQERTWGHRLLIRGYGQAQRSLLQNFNVLPGSGAGNIVLKNLCLEGDECWSGRRQMGRSVSRGRSRLP